MNGPEREGEGGSGGPPWGTRTSAFAAAPTAGRPRRVSVTVTIRTFPTDGTPPAPPWPNKPRRDETRQRRKASQLKATLEASPWSGQGFARVTPQLGEQPRGVPPTTERRSMRRPSPRPGREGAVYIWRMMRPTMPSTSRTGCRDGVSLCLSLARSRALSHSPILACAHIPTRRALR